MRPYKYILDERGEPVPCRDLFVWAKWLEEHFTDDSPTGRIVARTDFPGGWVSTIFLMLDHSFGGPTPILWETMVMGGENSGDCDRCGGSREQALAMHEAMVARSVHESKT
jgi:hypothetical protein